MKFKTTRKAVMDGYSKVIEIGYCDAQWLLVGEHPVAYTCGVYGWNADIYELSESCAVCTGYRPFGNVRVDYDTIEAFNARAKEICHNDAILLKCEPLGELRREFVKATCCDNA